MHGLTATGRSGHGRRMPGERYHNAASEFAAAVRASGPVPHAKKLVGAYNTPIAWAFALLNLPRKFNKLEPYKSWRRGLYKPPAWACHLLADELRERGDYLRKIAAELQPGPGQGNPESLRRWRAQKAAEKEKGAEAPLPSRE